MSRREWRCRNRACPVPHGAVLGRLTADGGLVLVPAVAELKCYLDTGKAVVGCPACGAGREFRGSKVIASPREKEHGVVAGTTRCN
jgi:hypothetical protein